MKQPRCIAFSIAVVMFFVLGSGSGYAQGTARSLDLDVSIRAAGMGQASNAVFWGDGVDQWANPALLGYQRGIRYEWGKTQLVPGLSSSVFFKTSVIELGGGGFGVSLSGKPFDGLGGLDLDYGLSQGTDENGNPTGTFASYEKVHSWGLGVSVARAVESLGLLTGRDPPAWSRMADVSLGMTSKQVEVVLGPNGQGRTSSRDRGLLLRLSPLECVPAARDLPIGLDLAYAWSELSYSGGGIQFPTETGPDPISSHRRRGYAGRAALEIPAEIRDRLEHRRWGWFALGFEPLVSYGLASDHAAMEPSAGQWKTDGRGYEVTVANLWAYRSGHYEDPLDQIDGDTRGWSVGLPIGRVAGVRYERATFPQSRNSGLGDVDRKAISGWIDPLQLWALLHTREPSRESR